MNMRLNILLFNVVQWAVIILGIGFGIVGFYRVTIAMLLLTSILMGFVVFSKTMLKQVIEKRLAVTSSKKVRNIDLAFDWLRFFVIVWFGHGWLATLVLWEIACSYYVYGKIDEIQKEKETAKTS